MKTYHGVRSERGCEVTVDGEPLKRRSDLSGSATSTFDWGFVGTGQLSLALLADFLGDDSKAKAMWKAFEENVVAELPHRSWTLRDQDLTDALASLTGADGAIAQNNDNSEGFTYGDSLVESMTIPPPAGLGASGALNHTAHFPGEHTKSSEELATDAKSHAVTEAAGEIANAANRVAAAAMAVGKAAQQVAHAGERPSDEPMSTANRAADQKADATNRVVDEAAVLARSAVDEANRVVAKLA
jgi:uncharacterized protein DUF6166